MKLSTKPSAQRQAGMLTTELMIALGLLTVAVIPFAYTFVNEQRQIRRAHHRAVATEVVDGEAEILAAGTLREFAEGENPYPLMVGAATNLPPGRFLLRRSGSTGVLEWQPAKADQATVVRREFRLLTPGGVR